jgi:hypothetical protein
MIKNNAIRHQPVISRTSDDCSDELINELKNNLEKDAVQSREKDKSLYDQINNIINNKSKYPSVQAAVEDMKERSGLNTYLKNKNIKKASDNNQVIDKKVDLQIIPTIIKARPEIESTFRNCIQDSKGNLSIPAIISRVKGIHSQDASDDKDWDDPKLTVFVAKLNLEEKAKDGESNKFYNNLGKSNNDNNDADPSNTDAFSSLMPATK